MAVYVRIPNPQTPDELAAAAIAYLQAVFPNWVPPAGGLATIFIEAQARNDAELWDLVSTVEDDIFLGFGPLAGITPIPASPAGGLSTWTMSDDAGYTIPAGTHVGIRTAGDTLVAFQTAAAVTVSPGDTVTADGEVALTAVDAGAAGSGLGGPAFELELIDTTVPFVNTAVLTGVTTGGVDAEPIDDYMDRLKTELQLLTPRPILPNDFAVLARRIPGVGRSLALDLYNPTDDTFGNERMVSVVVADASGEPVSGGVKTEVDASLQAMREVNFVVWVIDATYTTIDAASTFTIYAGYDADTVAGQVVAALTNYLSPANWGRPRVGDTTVWLNVPTVRYLELAQVVNNVEGVDYITSLMFAAQAHKNYAVVATTDVFTITAHGYSNGDPILVTAATDGDPITVGTVYYARDVTANTYKLAATAGGAAIDITTDGSGTVTRVGTADVTLTGRAPLPRAGSVSAGVA